MLSVTNLLLLPSRKPNSGEHPKAERIMVLLQLYCAGVQEHSRSTVMGFKQLGLEMIRCLATAVLAFAIAFLASNFCP